jgi:RNA polymerase-binding protein DksA
MSLDTERFRADLESRRERLVGVIERREHPDSLEDGSGEVVANVDNHLADTATETHDRELDEGIEEDAERTLEQVDAALGRIEAGTYGTCEVCGRPIGAERLEAVPYTTLCIDDARKLEQG